MYLQKLLFTLNPQITKFKINYVKKKNISISMMISSKEINLKLAEDKLRAFQIYR